MYTRYLLLIALLATHTYSFGQKVKQYAALDSVKKVQTLSISVIKTSQAPKHTIDSLKDLYKEVKDSMRDEVRDHVDSLIEHMDKCSHFEVALDIASRQLIDGRSGPANGVVGSPSLKYVHKSGFYAMFNTDEYKLIYKQASIQKRPPKIDTTTINKIESDITLTAGFARTFWEKWDLDASLDHTFIFYGKDKTYLSNSFNLNNSFDFWSYISVDLYYSLLFGGSSNTPASEKKYSNIITAGISHDFKIYRFLGSKVFTITPEFLVDAGNDNYVRNRLLARNQNGGLDIIKPATDNFFGLLNIEGSINIDYRIKNLEIYVDPRVAVPFNVVPFNATNPSAYRNNTTAGPIFYVTTGVKYLFRFWKEQPGKQHAKGQPKKKKAAQ